MNSVSQTILGLVLVGTAFIFGSYLHREKPGLEYGQPSQTQNDTQTSNYVWQDDLPHAHQQTGAAPTSMPSLKSGSGFKPLNNRQPKQLGLVEANLVPDLSIETNLADSANPANTLAIAEPDFSRYAIDDYRETAQDIAPPRPLQQETRGKIATVPEIATPDFGQHFPSEIRVNRNQNSPSSDRQGSGESLFRLRRPNLNSQHVSTPTSGSQIQYEPQPYYDRRDQRLVDEPIRPQPAFEFEPLRTPERTQTVEVGTGFRPITGRQSATGNLPNQPSSNSNRVGIVSRNRSPIMRDPKHFGMHQTSEGETLHDLAVKYYGDSAFYLDIYVVNQDVLDNPGRVPAGIALRIPNYEQ